jgi:SAM-dependent methyltransferase
MAQRTTGWRRVFSAPAVYRLAQRTIGSPTARRAFVHDYLRPDPGARILDMGCGTGELASRLEDVDYVGFDPSPDYIDAARERHGDRGTFVVGGVGDVDVPSGSFDLCVAKGVLHHLDDDIARALARQAYDALRPGGRLVTMDPVFQDGQSRIARFLAERDRGRNVRTLAAYEEIAATSFGAVDGTVRHNLLRVPYSHALLVCTR